MVEKVARELFEAEHPGMQPGWTWGKAKSSPAIRASWMALARVSILAMREPSEGMLMAGTEPHARWEISDDPYLQNMFREVWRAQIDAALVEAFS